MKRLLLVFLLLALLVIIPFLIWGDAFERRMTLEGTVEALQSAGSWAWAVGISLLVIDLFLPVLGTVVMSALGLVYGWFLGGLLASLGSVGAGLLAYGLCRSLGRPIARRIAGEEGLREGERLFRSEGGGWIVALSRWMPVLPEAIACLAGLSRMPLPRFLAALCAGSIPLGFVFAIIGASGVHRPGLALLLSAGLPPLLWTLLRVFYFTKRHHRVNDD